MKLYESMQKGSEMLLIMNNYELEAQLVAELVAQLVAPFVQDLNRYEEFFKSSSEAYLHNMMTSPSQDKVMEFKETFTLLSQDGAEMCRASWK